MCLDHTTMAEKSYSATLPVGLEVVDAHCHLAWEHCVPPAFIQGALDNLLSGIAARRSNFSRSAILDRFLGMMQDPHADGLVRSMREAGIVRSNLLVPDMTYALPNSKYTIEELLIHHHQVAQRHPGMFELFAGVDPRWGADGIALFERAVSELGYRGLKVYPPCGFDPSHDSMFPYYEICAAKGFPVLVHIGPTSPALSFSTSHPLHLDRACQSFPNVNFILGHGAASFATDCIALAAFRPNVFIELSGIQSVGSLPAAVAKLRPLSERGLNHKILFGSDFPVFQVPLGELAAAVFDERGPLSDASEADVRLVASGNVRRLWRFADPQPSLAFEAG